MAQLLTFPAVRPVKGTTAHKQLQHSQSVLEYALRKWPTDVEFHSDIRTLINHWKGEITKWESR